MLVYQFVRKPLIVPPSPSVLTTPMKGYFRKLGQEVYNTPQKRVSCYVIRSVASDAPHTMVRFYVPLV